MGLISDVIIVGHGPSLLRMNLGEYIDTRPVVRLKRCLDTLQQPLQYGTRTDAVCGSWTIRNALFEVPAKEYWTFVDSRHDPTAAEIEAWPGYLNQTLCEEWNRHYRALRTPWVCPKEQKEGPHSTITLGHRHLSAGFHAILYCCQKWKPKTISLLGFDNMISGTFTWSVTRGPDWTHYPDHRWDLEQQLLLQVEDVFEVKFICAQ